MIKIEDISKNVHFDEPTHKYTLNGKNLTSITTILSIYKPPFDPTGVIAGCCAKRDGITKLEVQQKWEDKKNKAGDRGTKFHAEIENYINTGNIVDGEYKEIITEFSKIRPKEKLYSEVVLSSERYGAAGTADIVRLFDDNSIQVMDWKTNEVFQKKSKYGGKFYYSLNYLKDFYFFIFFILLLCFFFILVKF